LFRADGILIPHHRQYLPVMLTDIPKQIDGAKTLFIAKSYTLFETVVRDNKEISIEFIAVCQYKDDSGFYLFGCDKEFNAHTDFYYDDLDDALVDAKRIYQNDNITWTQIN
jgi:hypothetical protein